MQVTRVLVVDDCKAARVAAQHDLGARHVLLASDVATALQFAREHQHDLAIVDQRLGPGELFGAGLGLVEQLKRLRPEMFVALVTGLLTLEAQRLAYQLGADLVLEKVGNTRGSWIPVAAILRHVEDGIAAPTLDRDNLRKLARVERDHIIDVLRECAGNISRAASQLGVDRATVKRRLDEMLSIELQSDRASLN